ncbi:hypothetical protein [Alicyclobacillus sp. TC]|uniref:hypothetical protein n=1 Tax=Alicyclobacillus sp. TC TaxID=2606450 RepID=UPI001EE3D935|nr:hypothetical protein [Alicyclobacillus sp. TC]
MVNYFFAFLIGHGSGILDISGFFASDPPQNFTLSFPRLALSGIKKRANLGF